MTVQSPPGHLTQSGAQRRTGLTSAPACLASPRAGAPRIGSAARGLAALPQRSPRDSSLTMTAAGFPGLQLDLEHERGRVDRQIAERELEAIGLAYLRAERSAGVPPHEQISAVAEYLRQIDRARGARAELIGPVSLALQVVDELERPLAYDPPLREALTQHIIMRTSWLHDQLALGAGSALINIDEPFLDALGSPFCPLNRPEGYGMLARALSETPHPRGLCISGAPDWELLLRLPADIVYFDAYEQSASLIKAASLVAAYLDLGGALGWGIVPTDSGALPQERAETLAHRFVSTAEYLADAGCITPERIAQSAFVSTSGSLGHLPADLAAHAAALCGEVSVQLRAHYKLDA